MKQHLVTCFSLLALFSLTVHATPETYVLDKSHSYVLWNVKHFGFSTQSGKWYAEGKLILDKDHPEQSKVEANINVAEMITGIPELDKHLKGKSFFDTDNFPKASFVSNKVNPVSTNQANVSGILTLRGVSKPVVLNVVLNKSGVNPMNNKKTAGFSASATIKRSDFGMNSLLPSVGDEVVLVIGAEATLAQ